MQMNSQIIGTGEDAGTGITQTTRGRNNIAIKIETKKNLTPSFKQPLSRPPLTLHLMPHGQLRLASENGRSSCLKAFDLESRKYQARNLRWTLCRI